MKNVVIIGGGPGGYGAALYSAQLGMNVTLIEKNYLGGTCLNVGCIPTKAFVQASKVYDQTLNSRFYGIHVDGQVTIDFKKTANFKKKIVTQLRNGVGYLLKKAKVNVISGTGKMLDPNTVQVTCKDGVQELQADEIIIATGSSEIDIPGFEPDGIRVLNSTQMLDIDKLPESVAIIGGGVIGVEFASIFKKFGKAVTIIELSPSLIPTEDAQIGESLKESLVAQGINVLTGAQAKKVINKTADNITLEIQASDGSNQQLTVEQVLVCVGRKANLSDIGLEELGIVYNKKFIETNEKMQTNIPNIYAIGDVTKSPQLAHVAYYEAKVAVLNIAGKEAKAEYHAIPGCIFSHPEVARVGMTEKEARENVTNLSIKTESFAGNGKAMIEKENEGYVKMLFDNDNGRIVGVSIIGPKATELIAEPTLAVTLKLPVEELANTINAHPSLSEIIGEAAGAAIGLGLHS
ncbi:dihydrolipoyl dehydrogenase [Sporomusa sphaeroides]|uniref:dihydrolipoyl dehydrogenase n=1 Tax=Sporomusa sphaeroides TaxID=47679 RepID=UPI002BEC3749|nr:dihydrolipoyl dehydrogenase [Sporomusa sphaeroides]HML31829.1 dihydrolipoyl dehydrogenase [Sporomusa sphaeroides]